MKQKKNHKNGDVSAQRLLEAIELMEFGIELMRQNISRRLPGVSAKQVNSELERWLIKQPKNFVPESDYTPDLA